MDSLIKIITKSLSRYFSKKVTIAATDKMNKMMANKQIDYTQQFEFKLVTPKYSFYAGAMFILLGIGGIVLIVIEAMKDTYVLNGDSWALIAIVALVFFGSIVLTVDAATKYVLLGNSFINMHSVLVKDVEMRWTEVDKVVFKEKQFMQLYKGKEKIRIYFAYVGSVVALRMLHDKVDLDVYVVPLVQNEHYYKAFLHRLTDEELDAWVETLEEKFGKKA